MMETSSAFSRAACAPRLDRARRLLLGEVDLRLPYQLLAVSGRDVGEAPIGLAPGRADPAGGITEAARLERVDLRDRAGLSALVEEDRFVRAGRIRERRRG